VTAGDENGRRTAEFVTPTGARYRSAAPPLPGAPMVMVSEVEIRIGVELADLHAA
jgi:G:T-mismatch repair DNA endonuclease (very short patch repair protein)